MEALAGRAFEFLQATQPQLIMPMRSLLMLTVLFSALVFVGDMGRGAVPESLLARPALQKIHPSLRSPGIKANVLVRLQDPPLIAKLGRNAKQLGFKLNRSEQVAYSRQLRVKQSEVAKLIRDGGGQLVGFLTASQNAVLAVVDTDRLPAISELATVMAIRPVIDSEIELSATIPHIGAAGLHQAGVTGEGIRVAVLDSGIDYTHRNFGGPGTLEAYGAAYGAGPSDPLNKTRDSLFPTEKVAGGWDFVGEVWPTGPGGGSGPIEPDEDPIDYGAHGSHVADIIAGASVDGTHKGVAPGATLYAFKVCSAVSTACNGFAILLGLDACLHPNNPEWSLELEENGELLSVIDEPVDVINLSLGSVYGQIQDDKSYVIQLFTDFGITVVTAAGNDGDRPYVLDSPSVAPGAISVAQTQVPGARSYSIRTTVAGNRGRLTTLQNILNTAEIAWAPLDREVLGTTVYLGRGCPSDSYPIAEVDIVGKVVVIDRGVCAVSEKVDKAGRAGAVGVIVVNNAPGEPPTFSQGNGSQFVPTLVVTQGEGTILKSLIAGSPRAQSAFGPSTFTSLAGSMASTSSRGPSYSFQSIKPEIGAPGASVSAVAGTGTGQEAFGGTSGATPIIAGAAALIQSVSLQESGLFWAPWALKALLMNNADPNVQINPASSPGVLAPITRVGAGEVRVDRALDAKAFAFVVDPPIESGAPDDYQPALSFGYHPVIRPGPLTLTKDLVVVNLANETRTFTLGRTFRYADDQASGAVTLDFSASTVEVAPGGSGEVTVTLTLDPTKLQNWTLNGGTQGGNGTLLSGHEYDGYIQIQDADDSLSLPWHILPRKAADLAIGNDVVDVGGSIPLSNLNGAAVGTTEVFALSGTSPVDYPKPDPFGFNEAWPDLEAVGVRAVGPNLELAFTFHHDWSHPATPVGVVAYIDRDGDGWEDLELLTTEVTGVGAAEVLVSDLNTETTLGVFPVDADLNASAMILRVPLAVLGLDATSTLDWYALSWDNYFTGAITDFVVDDDFLYLRHKLDQPRYGIAGAQTRFVAIGGAAALQVHETPDGAEASPSQAGFLFVHRQAQPGRWSDIVTVAPLTVPE